MWLNKEYILAEVIADTFTVAEQEKRIAFVCGKSSEKKNFPASLI